MKPAIVCSRRPASCAFTSLPCASKGRGARAEHEQRVLAVERPRPEPQLRRAGGKALCLRVLTVRWTIERAYRGDVYDSPVLLDRAHGHFGKHSVQRTGAKRRREDEALHRLALLAHGPGT